MKKRIIAVICASMAVCTMGCTNTTDDTASTEESEITVAEEDVTTTINSDDYVFGTATLSYSEFYSGDVSSTASYDGVSSATANKYEIFPNMDTDYVDETTNADGYHITGVKNVNVAVPADAVDEYKTINDTFVESDETPAQYKVVSVENGEATYSETYFNVADTVTDANIELLTGSVWGDYELDITETSTSYIKNTRDDGDFTIDSNIQGIIVETASGLKVGMEYLQSVWVQPYEISFNISADNSHNTHVSYDNLTELDKLENETVTAITFINQNDTYIYEFDGVFIKPVYRDSNATAIVNEADETVTLSDIPEDLENPSVTVTYIVGEGKESVKTVVYEGAADENISLDSSALSEAKADGQEGSYSVVISSDNYADIAVTEE